MTINKLEYTTSELHRVQVVDRINGLQDGSEVFDKITLKGLPQTTGAPSGFGDLGSALYRMLNVKSIDNFNLSALTTKTDLNNEMQIPSPYVAIDDGIVHPCVVYDTSMRFGFKYIMAYTPLANGSDRYENPTCCASNDLITWVPFGPQPIVQAPPAPAYNADTHIQISPDGSRLYIMYRRREGAGGINQLMLIESSDGQVWSTPVAIKTGLVGTQDYASPSFWFNPAENKWVCITSNLDNAARPLQIFKSADANIFSTWGSETTVVAPHPSSGTWWHCYIDRLPNGVLLALNQDGGPGGGDLYWMSSIDGGLNFRLLSKDNENIPSNYRSCFFKCDNGYAVVRGRFNWFFNLATFDDSGISMLTQAKTDSIGTIQNNPLYFFADLFNRANGALGADWAAYDANTFVISGNTAVPTGSGNCIAYTNFVSNFFNGEVGVKVLTAGTSFFLRVRETNSVNVVRVGWNALGGNILIQEVVGGSVQSTTNTKKRVYSGDVFSVVVNQSKLIIKVNGIQYFEYQINFAGTSSRVAIQASGAVATVVDNFFVTDLISIVY